MKNDATINRSNQEIQIGNLIDKKLKVNLEPLIIDSAQFKLNYFSLDSVQHLVLGNLNADQNPYHFKIILLKDSLQQLFSSTNGTLYISSGLLRTLESFQEVQALMLHQFYHVAHHHISDYLITKYGIETYNMAALARDIYNLNEVEIDVQNIEYNFMEERQADADSDSLLNKLERNDALPLAYLSLGLGTKQGNLNFFKMHYNYVGRVNELLSRAEQATLPTSADIISYHYFLSKLPN